MDRVDVVGRRASCGLLHLPPHVHGGGGKVQEGSPQILAVVQHAEVRVFAVQWRIHSSALDHHSHLALLARTTSKAACADYFIVFFHVQIVCTYFPTLPLEK